MQSKRVKKNLGQFYCTGRWLYLSVASSVAVKWDSLKKYWGKRKCRKTNQNSQFKNSEKETKLKKMHKVGTTSFLLVLLLRLLPLPLPNEWQKKKKKKQLQGKRKITQMFAFICCGRVRHSTRQSSLGICAINPLPSVLRARSQCLPVSIPYWHSSYKHFSSTRGVRLVLFA